MMEKKLIHRLEEVNRNRILEVGGKASYLGELLRLGMPVPGGFVISTEAFNQFLIQTRYSTEIKHILGKAIELKDVGAISTQLQNYLAESTIPSQILERIRSKYCEFSLGLDVAVRSSANIEDRAGGSFAGQAESYLFVPDFETLIKSIKKCWASLFSPKALLYIISKYFLSKISKYFLIKDVKMAVIIQEMVESDVSGVMFTANVLNKNLNQILINSTWGSGETIAGGKVIADEITVRKKPLEIVKSKIGTKELMSVKNEKNHGTVMIDTPANKRETSSLSEDQVIQLSKLGMLIEEKLCYHQDIEFAVQGGEIKILQTRPITTPL